MSRARAAAPTPSATKGASTVEVGDYVTVGEGELTWKVTHIYPLETGATSPTVWLTSGQTGRSRYCALDTLHLHTKASPE